MSRLHNPGPGEILDRLTILFLKITYGQHAGRDITHWEDELGSLFRSYVQSKYPAHEFELAAVNAALWQAEDEMREYRREHAQGSSEPAETGAEIGVRIQALNDRRAELVALINTNAGVRRPGEKM